MQSDSLKDKLVNKYIICSCEGTAEESIIDLLLDNEKLCFKRSDLVDGECTRIRQGKKIASDFFGRAYGKDIAILRILDREQENFKLPKIYRIRSDISVFNIVTKPEIEILHIIAENLLDDFNSHRKHEKDLKPSEYCKAHFQKSNVKTKDFILQFYGNDIDKLLRAIASYRSRMQQQSYSLSDILDCE